MNDANDGEPSATKARLPKGFQDRTRQDLVVQETILATIRATFELYGYDRLETPFVEFTDALGKFLPDTDRPNEGVFSFQDDDQNWLSLRYDLTAPLARHVAEHIATIPKPFRSARSGYVFRNEKPGPGRFRQFVQCDADIVGTSAPAADAELCIMAAHTFEALGLRDNHTIKLNTRKVLDGIVEGAAETAPSNDGQRLTILRAIDKLDRIGIDGVCALLGAGRRDDSGDFTAGARLNAPAIDRIVAYLSSSATADNQDLLDGWERLVRNSAVGREGVDDLRKIAALCRAAGDKSDHIRIDPSVVRGLEYYTGAVFEGELTEPASSTQKPHRYGSVGGGGRYDDLISRFGLPTVPATGFSFGISRLVAILTQMDNPVVASSSRLGPVVVLVLDRDRIGDYQTIASSLRSEGIPTELYTGDAGMKAQMKYADRRNAPVVVIQGSNEYERGEVQIKDLIAGREMSANISTSREWKDARPAQVAVKTAELTSSVRQILDKYR